MTVHNHKFDPLSNHDYYRLGAVLNPLKRPLNGRTELDLPAGTLAQRAALMERDRRIDEVRKQIAALPDDMRQRIAELERQIVSLRDATPDLPRRYFMTESTDPPPKSFLLFRGQASARGPEVQPAVPVVLTKQDAKFSSPPSIHGTSGRRLAFARWMASTDNPLTARVIVNRVWQYHFGEGLVRTPSDFGVIGETPTHPELLDWLADWFARDANWSIKKLHRLILSSSTYQMSKADHPLYVEQDPRNVTMWRFPYRRLEVEAIRDSDRDRVDATFPRRGGGTGRSSRGIGSTLPSHFESE
ncbi:MAG: DUF1553 domain-containing protein [Planctomycetaceae bacterium]